MTLRYAMKPATPMPIITSASSTLTAATIPRSRLLVPNSPDMMMTSERRHLVARLSRRRLSPFAERVVQQRPAFVGDSRCLLNRVTEADDLPREAFECRLDLSTDAPPTLSKEQVPGDTTDDGPHHRGRDC